MASSRLYKSGQITLGRLQTQKFLSKVQRLTNTTFTYPSPSALKINKDRLWADIHHTCQWGQGERWGVGETETGMSRLALSDSDREARNWFVATTESLGCSTRVDSMVRIVLYPCTFLWIEILIN